MFSRKIHVKVLVESLSNVRNYAKYAPQLNKFSFRSEAKRKKHEDLIGMALESIPVRKPQDWKKITQFVLEQEVNRTLYNSENIDGMIMGHVARLQRTDLAKSFLKYLEEENTKPNLATLGKYLKLLYQNNLEKLSKEDEKEILNLCISIEQNNPVLDPLTQDSMIMALSLTKGWKKCLKILQEIKITSVPSILTYSALTAAAFRNKDEQLAWDLLEEMLDYERPPLSLTFQAYLKTIRRLKKRETILHKLEKLFLFFTENQLICREDVAKGILEFCNKSGNIATVKFSGQCENCNTNLTKFELTDSEFSELKEVFFKNVIVGKDIFMKSDPGEMKAFQDFVGMMGEFDVVLDGLNIAYSAGTRMGGQFSSNMVAAVISHFVQQNKSVLMLGRVHMKKWPRNNWNYITRNSTVFLTQNISQDDPYLLYCALHSGKDTTIVTRDLMRSHKYLLKERKYKMLFDRWLSQRQHFLLYVNDQNRATFRRPPHFTAIAQKNENIWHIPYIPETDNSMNEKFHRTWICLDFGKEQK